MHVGIDDDRVSACDMRWSLLCFCRDTRVTLVPIMVGAITYESEAKYGAALAPYLDDPGNMFVISSDFCHWGQRFQFTFFDEHKVLVLPTQT